MSKDEDGLFAAPAKGGFPSVAPTDTVEFGWQDDTNKKLSGRRKKLQRKAKPGSFGESAPSAAAGAACCLLKTATCCHTQPGATLVVIPIQG